MVECNFPPFLFGYIKNILYLCHQLRTIKNNKTMTTDMIIWFECDNGNKYYINKDFIPIRIKSGETTLDEIKENAKRYTEKGYKRIFTILHKKYHNEIYACYAESLSLHLEKFRVYEDNLLLF